jgi:alkyldihydroxyacetonephosphate synthase
MDLNALRQSGIYVTDSTLHLSAYRRDLWPRDTLQLLTQGERPDLPAAVASPTSAEQVAACIEWAVREGVQVVPYGAGSGVCGGARGRAGSLIIDLKRLNRIRHIDPNNRTVWIEAGILGQHLEDQLAQIGWMTAHSPSSIACSTAGGYIAARSAGQFSSRYGVFDDMTLAARAETPTGRLHCGQWTPPDQEDLLPILTGSEGGLGVVTDLLVRLQPQPETRWLRGFAFESTEAALDAMRALMQANLWPSVLRLYDPVDTKIGGKTKASDAKSGGGIFGWLKATASKNPALQKHLLSLPLAMPGLLNRIGRSLGNEVLLIVGFEGPLAVVNSTIQDAAPLLQHGRDLGPEPGEQWFAHRHDVSYKLAPVFIAGAFADTMEVAATWDRLGDLYESVRGALSKHTAVMAHFSHAYREGCSIYFSFAGRGTLKNYDATWRCALQAARDAGGTVTHHHGVGVLKAAAAAKEAGAALRVWTEIKRELDPDGLMNPGRPFPEDAQPDNSCTLPAPTGGPVFDLNGTNLLARIDPEADPMVIQSALHEQGYSLRYLPDRPYGAWIDKLERGSMEVWQSPLFGLQARFDDGAVARIFPAPRSAAGPDLRWSLNRRAKTEWMDVPIRPHGDEITVSAHHPNLDQRDVRPVWRTEEIWGFSKGQRTLAENCFLPSDDGSPPSIKPLVKT